MEGLEVSGHGREGKKIQVIKSCPRTWQVTEEQEAGSPLPLLRLKYFPEVFS